MKKIVSLFLCVLLLAAAAVTVQAEEVPNLTIRAGNSAPRPGDSVDFTVTIDPIEGCRSGGIVLSYDERVFEFVSGQCLVSDAFMADFTDGTGVFAFAEGKTVSGNVFRFTLRVKAYAAYGDHTVSCKTNFRTDVGSVTMRVIGAGISLNCEHTYGSWTVADALAHQRDCSKCGKQEMHSHTWDEGWVTKQPTCKEEGQALLTCTACGTTKTQTLEKTDSHTYGGCEKVDGSIHKRSCAVCGQEETASHNWNSGKITKQPSCKESGIKTYTCADCGATRTEPVAKTEDHDFDNACDTSCGKCGLSREAKHSYGSDWSCDRETHSHVCSICGEKKDSDAHTPGKEATETSPQRCTVCGYVIQAALDHKHSFASELSYDESGHWYPCSGCADQELTEHDFESACDAICETCGYIREITHDYGGWQHDGAGHWQVCGICGELTESAAHIPGEEATEDTAQTCVDCGYELAPKLEPVEASEEAAQSVPDRAEEPQSGSRNFLWIVILLATIVGGAAIGTAVYLKRRM